MARLVPLLPLALAAALAGCGKKQDAPPPPRPAMTMVVAPSPAFDMVLSGSIQPQVQTPFGFRVIGRMIARPVKAGDRVEKGQTLAAIDPLSLEMAMRSATASLASARAQYDNAASTEARQAALLEKKTTSQAAFDTVEQERAAAQANMQQAEANLAKAKEQLSYAVLTADYSGIVTATYAEVGQTVSPGQAVVALAEPTRRDAVIDATDSVVDALWIGQKFDVSLQIDPANDGLRNRARNRAGIGFRNAQPPREDRAGQSAGFLPHRRDHFRPARHRNRARPSRIPDSALLRDGDKDARLRRRSGEFESVVARCRDRARPERRPLDRARGPQDRRADRHSRRPPPQGRRNRAHLWERDAVSRFNLSQWSLDRRSLIWYFMLVFLLAGFFSYVNLGREEDPNFTIKTMVIQANWPGATADEVTLQVTERIERKLEELESLDFTRSITTAGNTIVFVNLLPTTKARDVEPTWVRVRNMIADIKSQFPTGVQGPFFNDRFGDVFGNIYAFTADGLTLRQLRDQVEFARSRILTVPNVGRVDLIGEQDEAIYLEFSTRQIAALGLDIQAITNTLAAQNAVTASGFVQAGPERIAIRVSGQFTSEESLRAINLRVNDRFFPLTDVATIHRGYVDPPTKLFRYNGEPAIGLAIGMKQGANLLEFGAALEKKIEQIKSELPVGVDIYRVSDQPAVVDEAVSGFTRGLFEAVIIVLAISFISLGWRAGLVVAIAIPLVLAITFLVMRTTDISLQRISLGALIIALGLLVDDAMIAVEMMVARLEAGDDLRTAATYVYTSTAFPMLTGTLVTVAGFIPVGLNTSAAGEFTFTLFVVIAVSLVVSRGSSRSCSRPCSA